MSWPTTSDPKTEFVTSRFTVSEAAELDVAAQQFPSRSAFVRDCVRRCIVADRKRAARLKKGGEE